MTEELPFAPRRTRPLAWWNPLDYLVLLYWVFFFPQAIRWYLDEFGHLRANAGRVQGYRNSAHISMVFCACMVTSLCVVGVRTVLPLAGARPGLFMLFGTLLGSSIGIVMLRKSSVAVRVAAVVVPGVVGGITGGLAITLIASSHSDGVESVAWVPGMLTLAFLMPCVVWALAHALSMAIHAGVSVDYGYSLEQSVQYIVVCCVMLGVFLALHFAPTQVPSLLSNLQLTDYHFKVPPLTQWPWKALSWSVAATAVALVVVELRVDVWIMALLPALLQPSKDLALSIQRSSPLPIPGLETRLVETLRRDWEVGIRDCEGLLRYSLQFVPVIRAIRRTLAEKAGNQEETLYRIMIWCDLDPHDWNAIRFQSASLGKELFRDFPPWVLFGYGWTSQARQEWSECHAGEVSYASAAEAACAGMWHLYRGELEDAAVAFRGVRHLDYGEEMWVNSNFLWRASLCKNFGDIGELAPAFPVKGHGLLRPGVAALIAGLSDVVKRVRDLTGEHSASQRNQSADAILQKLASLCADTERCEKPERLIVERIANDWRRLAVTAADEIGEGCASELRKVPNLYITGPWVPADRLVGRQSVYDAIKEQWSNRDRMNSIVVYGHRRMGKTSVMRNLLSFCHFGPDTRLAYLTLQKVSLTDSLIDICHEIALVLWKQATNVHWEKPTRECFVAGNPLGALGDFLEDLRDHDEGRRFVLVLDEYENLDRYLSQEVGRRFLEKLRGLLEEHPWLVVALVGLHNLKERTKQIYGPIYSWPPVRVGFLDERSVAGVLKINSAQFPLVYEQPAVAEIHRLTGGQPFLVQLVGRGLVMRFNQQSETGGRQKPRFTVADVEALLSTGWLFSVGGGYFDGIWEQSGEGGGDQQRVQQVLAPHRDGLDLEILADRCRIATGTLERILITMKDHDLIFEEDRRYRFTVELMRRWVEREQCGLAYGLTGAGSGPASNSCAGKEPVRQIAVCPSDKTA